MPNSANRLAKSTPTLFIKPKLGNSANRLVKYAPLVFVEHDPAVDSQHKLARLAVVPRAVPMGGKKDVYHIFPAIPSSLIAKLNHSYYCHIQWEKKMSIANKKEWRDSC